MQSEIRPCKRRGSAGSTRGLSEETEDVVEGITMSEELFPRLGPSGS